jgi:hypothetical protein
MDKRIEQNVSQTEKHFYSILKIHFDDEWKRFVNSFENNLKSCQIIHSIRTVSTKKNLLALTD